VDLLGDGYSTFRYAPTVFLAPNSITNGGALQYGQQVVSSSFDPSCAGYAYVVDRPGRFYQQQDNREGELLDVKKIFFDAFSVSDSSQ